MESDYAPFVKRRPMSGVHPADGEPYRGIITLSVTSYGQTVDLGWSPAPTNLSVRRMIGMLRRAADELERGLPR